jgi:S-adenosylmethionine hydrolase
MVGKTVVACLTDFGTADYYAGALRGTLAEWLPEGSIVDVTHEIPPGDVRRAAMVLWEVQPAFPKGTVFLAIVDPEVGSSRAAAAFRFPECDVVCPDNGIATFLMERFADFQTVAIDPRRMADRPISNTFHGRDLFAPAAARLALGQDPFQLGDALPSPTRIRLPVFLGGEREGWEGEVLYLDRFGNAITSIGRIDYDLSTLVPWLRTDARGGTIPSDARVILEDGNRIPLVRTYADAKDGSDLCALAGGNGLLEIAAWKRPAGNQPALQVGARVRLTIPS